MPNRRADFEKIVGDFRSDHANFLVGVVFSRREEAPFRDYLRSGSLKLRQRALKRDLRGRFATTRDHQSAAKPIVRYIQKGNRQFNGRQRLKCDCIVVRQLFTHSLFPRSAANLNTWIKFADVYRTSAERLDFARHRNINAADNRSDQHHCNDADYHAKDG